MINDLLVVRLTEDRRTGNKHIRTRRGDFADIAGFHAAIHFQADVVAGRIDALAHFTQFIQRLGNKGLAAKARVNRHQQDHVQLIHHVIEVAQRRRRVELAGVLPEFFNETEWPVILEVETPRLKNAEVLKSYFRSLQGE